MPDGTSAKTEPMSFKDAAFIYLSLGWRVFPLAAGSHVPLAAGGHNNATRDGDTVMGWWGPNGNLQHANIGIATGRLSGIWVLDVDNHGSEQQNGFIKLKALTDANGELPPTVTAKSPRGGLHYYFKVPEDFDISSKAGILGAGLDSRSSGGYIVAPPSIRADRDNIRYAWEPGKSPEEIEVAETPEWMLTILREQNRKESAGEHDTARVAETMRLLEEDPAYKTKMTSYVRTGLDNELENIRNAAPGTGNDTLFRSAFKVGQLIGMGLLDEIATHQELLTAAMERGRSEHESRDVIDRAFARGKNLPRALPNAKDKSSKRPMMPVAEARGRLSEIFGRIRDAGDAGAPFERDALRVFSSLAEHDKAEWGRVKNELGKLGVGKREIDKAVKDQRKLEETPAEAKHRLAREKIASAIPIRCLGYDRGTNYYQSERRRQVTAIDAMKHQKLALLSLADLEFWEAMFGEENEAGNVVVNWDKAANWLLEETSKVGIYRQSDVLGRGVFLNENNSIVINTGKRLFVDQIETSFMQYKGKDIFEEGEAVDVDLSNVMSIDEGKKIQSYLCRWKWEDGHKSGSLIAGWIFVAVLSGALPWRPHVWIRAEPGSGKSWLLTNVIEPLMNNFGMFVQAGTTEAGIRQQSKLDSYGVVYDEAESETEKKGVMMQNINSLIRTASAADKDIVKGGGNNGGTNRFSVKQSFLLASITSAIYQLADMRRFKIASLLPNNDSANINEMTLEHQKLFDKDVGKRFQARSLTKARETLKAVQIFKRVGVGIFGVKGEAAADLYAPLVAGSWMIEHDLAPTGEEAYEYMKWLDLSEKDNVSAETQTEAETALQMLLSDFRVEYFRSTKEQMQKIPLGELVIAVMRKENTSFELSEERAKEALLRAGILVRFKADKWQLCIARNNSAVMKFFAETPYRGGWAELLSTFPGTKTDKIYLTSSISKGGVRSLIFDATSLFEIKIDKVEEGPSIKSLPAKGAVA